MKLKKILYIVLGCIGMGVGAVGAVLPLIPSVPIGRIVLGCVWVFHVFYFVFGVKTLRVEDVSTEPEEQGT